MYKDIISYKLANGVDEAHLLKVAKAVFNQWMVKQDGFINWQIHKQIDGTYTDIVTWQSKNAAKQAEADMGNIPNGAEWFACYEKGSISSQNLEQVTSFGDGV